MRHTKKEGILQAEIQEVHSEDKSMTDLEELQALQEKLKQLKQTYILAQHVNTELIKDNNRLEIEKLEALQENPKLKAEIEELHTFNVKFTLKESLELQKELIKLKQLEKAVRELIDKTPPYQWDMILIQKIRNLIGSEK